MDYQVDPTLVARGSGRSVAIVVAVVGIVIALIVAGNALSGPTSRPTAIAQRTVTPNAARPVVTCHDLLRARCGLVADAALAVIDDPVLSPVRAVEVWATLVCGNTFDCPPGHLSGRRIAGSVIIELADTRALWVNVTEDGGGAFDAWVIRTESRG